ARLVYVNMLDRERADFFRALDSLKEAFGPHVVATEIPIGTEHNLRGLIDLVDMKAYEYDASGASSEIPIPDELADQAQEYREKLMDEVAENSEALMERYLEGERSPTTRSCTRSRRARTPVTSSRSRAAWPPRAWASTGCWTRSS